MSVDPYPWRHRDYPDGFRFQDLSGCGDPENYVFDPRPSSLSGHTGDERCPLCWGEKCDREPTEEGNHV
jgi:hypothetical protein